MVWTIKYAPKSLKEFIDQKKALSRFLKWYKSFKPGKAALLYGPPGVGKTALVRTFAKDENLLLIEMNASDFRSAEKIKSVFGSSMNQMPFFKKSKIFLIDEVDGISGREDRGGVGEIIKIIKTSRFPVVLTANDPWDPKLRTLRSYCELIPFGNIPVYGIIKRLKFIAKKEGVEISDQALKVIAARAKGDLRAAINDLETVARGKKKIDVKDLEVLGFREKEKDIFEILKTIFKTKSILTPKIAIMNADRDPDEILWWIEENIANEYEKIEEIAKAYEMLSKADLFRKRIMRRQYWRFLVYMIEIMGGGVALAKKEMYRKFTKYKSPSFLRALGKIKREKAEVKQALALLSEKLHCSSKVIKYIYLPLICTVLRKKPKLKESFCKNYGLTVSQVNALLSLCKK
ncbi:MAG: replication factor C large subunit [Candidatus Aenigmarchaeota archaeon]|nr:replication factor C large subunit [Candidatus Aenigmarchaeota archaeon]